MYEQLDLVVGACDLTIFQMCFTPCIFPEAPGTLIIVPQSGAFLAG